MISIIIPVKNDERLLKEVFADYARQSFRDFEIITVVDSMTTDNSIDVCKAYADGTYVMEGKKTGRDMAMCALMRNYGALQSNGDILIHTDCDITFRDSNQLERILSYFVDNNLDVASARRFHEEAGLIGLLGELYHEFHPRTVVPIVIRKDVFNHLGGFEPRVLHDLKLDLVARAYGFKPVLIPERVVHGRMFNGVDFT